MPNFFYSLAVLACPVGMGAMMWVMMRKGKADAPSPTEDAAKLLRVSAEIDRLRAEQHPASGTSR